MRDTKGWIVAATSGLVGAVLAVLIAYALVSTRPVDVYAAGELSADNVAPPAGASSLVLVGDIMTWDRSQEYLHRYGAKYPFRATAPLLRTADLTVGNLEGPVAVRAERVPAPFTYKVPPWTLEGLSWAGFDLVGLANNHAGDCGPDGLLETFDHLHAAGIDFFGAGRDLAEARQPQIVPVGEWTVAFCGLLACENEPPDGGAPDESRGWRELGQLARSLQATEQRPGAMVATAENLAEMVRVGREGADFVVVFIHWGIRYRRQPTPLQRKLARLAIDAGADLVVGHHAHIWQPLELYRDKPIVYGLGNFAFGSGNRQADEGLLARVLFQRGRLHSLELFPLYTKNRDERVSYESKVMRGRSAEQLLRELAAQSDAPVEIVQGRGVLRLAQP